jgi:Flp pilus assembly pilin Flp
MGRTTHSDVTTLCGTLQALAFPRRDTTMLTLWIAAQNWVAFRDDRGASMVEYALLVVLIAIIAIVAIKFAGRKVSSSFSVIGSGLSGA